MRDSIFILQNGPVVRDAEAPARITCIPLIAIIGLAAVLQFRMAAGQGLWVDEAFSLAIATGHSLEHSAEGAQPSLGDFVEHATPVPASMLQRYLEPESPPAGYRRILRAVTMSDTSPPLYYLMLGSWIRVLGASDLALRFFSMCWAIAAFPLVWVLASRTGGDAAKVPSVVLLGWAPMLLHYATEGRMYSMLWFFAVALAAQTMGWRHEPRRGAKLLTWILVSACGFLTHYFFAFVWCASVFWLVITLGPAKRVFAAVAATVLLILPWYVNVARTFDQWRVTKGWLNSPLTLGDRVASPFLLAWNFLSGPRWSGAEWSDWAAGVVVASIAIAACSRYRRQLFTQERGLLWLWLVAACLGPVVFDLVNDTATETIPRYALAGAPAAILLVALGLTALSSALRLAGVLALVLIWSAGDRTLLSAFSREAEPFREIAKSINGSITESDLVIVHSIPSGVVALARYLGPRTPVAAWVGQLRRRHVPDDIQRLTEGRTKVLLVKVHDMNEPAPEERWMREHAIVIREAKHQHARVVTFAPNNVRGFAWGHP